MGVNHSPLKRVTESMGALTIAELKGPNAARIDANSLLRRGGMIGCFVAAVIFSTQIASQEQHGEQQQHGLSSTTVLRWPEASGLISPPGKQISRQMKPTRNSLGEWEFWIVSDDLAKLNPADEEGEGPFLVMAANENEKNSSTNIGAISFKVLLSTFKETSTIDPTEATVELVDHNHKVIHAVEPEVLASKVAKDADEWITAIWKYTHRRVTALDYVNGTLSTVNSDGSLSQGTLSGSVAHEDKEAEAENARKGKAWIADEVKKRGEWLEWILTKGLRPATVTPSDSAGGWIFFPRTEKWKDREQLSVRIPVHVETKVYIFEVPLAYVNDRLKTE